MPATSNYSSKPSAIGLLWPLLLLGLAIGLLVWWFRPGGHFGLNPAATSRPVEPRGDLREGEKNNIAVYERTASSVVHVTNLSQMRDKLTLDVQEVPRGTGSGFVWDEDGHVVTNYHVVDGADAAKVILADHTSYDVQNIWAYPDKDIAVVSIAAPKSRLRPIPIGTSHDLKVGQITFAIGNPFGLDQSMTMGIVSALGREVQSKSGSAIKGAIQTSAAINPGNSGGPLLDSAGRLIGMNTAIISPSGGFAGIGFAIPVDEINQIVPELIRKGKVVRPWVGVELADDHLARQLGVKQGALIVHVMPDSPAAAAGLKGTQKSAKGDIVLGDVIVAVGDQSIKRANDVYSALEGHKAGDTITLTILRSGQRQNVDVTLQARP